MARRFTNMESRQQLKRRHLEYFQQDDSGQWVYRGPYYTLPARGGNLLRLRRGLLLLSAVDVLCFVLMGVLPVDTNRVLTVMLPYALTLFPTALAVWCAYRAVGCGGRLTEYDYTIYSERLFLSVLFQILLLLAAGAGMAVFLAGGASRRHGANALFLLAALAGAGINFLLYRRVLVKCGWDREEA